MNCKIVADDYGMSGEINYAISELIDKNIVSKVSVMANESIKYSVNDIEKNVEVGLHINLISYTRGAGIIKDKKISPLKLIHLICTKQLDINQIIDNIKLQLEVLEDRGFKISYLDTHQYVHIIPAVLRALIIYAKTKRINSIRCITMENKYLFFYFYSLIRFGFLAQAPKMLILYFGGVFMKRRLDNAQVAYCKNLILMPLAVGGDYPGLLKEFINRFKEGDAEIVTHPGLMPETTGPDGYSKGRYVEYSSLLDLADFINPSE